MIAFLKGRFVKKTPALVYVDVNGVGYEVHISLHTYTGISGLQEGLLYTYFHVREDAQLLYGFIDEAEKEMFTQLISVSGVGASTARMMLSAMRPSEIAASITHGNTRQLESIKGIGKKSAERIILELRDKVRKIDLQINNEPLTDNTLENDALNALMALGIARTSGEQALAKVMKLNPHPEKIEDIVKQALKNI